MIPLRLTLKNFMCYGEDVPPLRFDSIHVACLCGDNGHGKTALLDAITWALWGMARTAPTPGGAVNSLNADELIHLGRTDMSVQLDFLANGQQYRVVRRRSARARGRSGRSTLELQVRDTDGAADSNGAGDGAERFRPISGSAIAQTNRRICEILNMDFKTFVNTAYLAQGQADLFTTSTPTERKKCLSDALDLSYYQRLSDGAKARSNAIHSDMRDNRTAVGLHREEAAQRPQYERRLTEARARIADVAPQAAERRSVAERLSGEAQALQARQTEFYDLERRLQSAKSDAASLQRQVRADESAAASYSATIDNAQQILDGFAALERWQAEQTRLDAALSRKNELDGKRSNLVQVIARQEERLSSDQRALQRRIADELEPRVESLPAVERKLAALDRPRADLMALAADIERKRNAADDMAKRVQALTQHNEHLRQDMTDTRQKHDMLKGDNAACPLCSRQLSGEAQQRLRGEYARAGKADRASYDKNVEEIDRLNAQRKSADAERTALERRKTSDERALVNKEANLSRDRRDAIEAQKALAQSTAELAKLTQVIDDGAFSENERKALADIDGELAALEYDAEAHTQARAQVGALGRFADERRALDEAQANLPRITEALQTNRQLLSNRNAEIAAAAERATALRQELATLPKIKAALNDAIASRDTLERALDLAKVKAGILQEKLANCDRLDGERRALGLRHAELADEKGIYDELTLAFGKNGIQALVIESAIPQLQDDANAILGRITEHRMHLRLELDEGTSERLEIRIADALGTRSYQTFSGGEAFRINFALRIALSRLLANRAGAPLPVLFIDEGFGSQDSAGQERLTEAIQSIQDEFQKIIVITHIEQVKNAFPVRIEVSKTDSGSTFAIV